MIADKIMRTLGEWLASRTKQPPMPERGEVRLSPPEDLDRAMVTLTALEAYARAQLIRKYEQRERGRGQRQAENRR